MARQESNVREAVDDDKENEDDGMEIDIAEEVDSVSSFMKDISLDEDDAQEGVGSTVTHTGVQSEENGTTDDFENFSDNGDSGRALLELR